MRRAYLIMLIAVLLSSCVKSCGCEDPNTNACVCLDSCFSDKDDNAAYLACLKNCNYEEQGECYSISIDAAVPDDAEVIDSGDDFTCPPEPCPQWCAKKCAETDASNCDGCLGQCQARC